MSSDYLPVTSDYLVMRGAYLVVAKYIVVMTHTIGTRESLVVTCDPLVVTRYYLVRRCALLCFLFCLCSAFGRPTLDLYTHARLIDPR